MNIKTKFMMTLGESAGAVFISAFLIGIVWSAMRALFTYILKKIGIDYFAEISESYRWIGQNLIESRAMLNADRACFYRCSNGEVFLEDSTIETNKGIKIYSIVNIVKNKSLTLLPETLERKYFDWFLEMQKDNDNYLEKFAQDLPVNSQLRNNLLKYSITAFLSVKVNFHKDLYGVIVYTWSDVKDIPKNLEQKHREYLDDLKNSVLIETIFIISRSIKFKFYRLIGVKQFRKVK